MTREAGKMTTHGDETCCRNKTGKLESDSGILGGRRMAGKS